MVGDCYEAAAGYLLTHSGILFGSDEADPDLVLVHAEVRGQGPIAGVRYGGVYPDEPPFKPNMHRYTPEEARRKMLEHGHYGPWDLKTSTGL